MDAKISLMWKKEIIDNESLVFSRVHKDFISSKDNLPKSSAFSNTPKEGNNLSCDWNKYCSSESSRLLIGKQIKKDGTFKNPELFSIWETNVGELRSEILPKQIVEHDPIFKNPEEFGLPNNQAHSIIIGEKPLNNAEFRVKLLKIGRWSK